MVIDFHINDLIKANDFKDSLFQFVAPESPTTIAGIEQGPFAKKNPGVLNEQEVNDLFFVIGGPGIGEMVA